MAKLLSRRSFLIAGGVLAGTTVAGLAVGIGYLGSLDTEGFDPMVGPNGEMMFNAFIRIDRSGRVTVMTPRTEMGQGVQTGLATLVAEELEVDPATVVAEHPIAELPFYGNYTLLLDTRPEDVSGPLQWVGKRVFAAIPYIGTGGSTSIQDAWVQYRTAGASAREMLISAAASRTAVKSRVRRRLGRAGQAASFGSRGRNALREGESGHRMASARAGSIQNRGSRMQ